MQKHGAKRGKNAYLTRLVFPSYSRSDSAKDRQLYSTVANCIKNIGKDVIHSDRSLLDLDQQLNPGIDIKVKSFDTIKNNMNYILHVTSIHPSDLEDYLIKPLDKLADAKQSSIPHQRDGDSNECVYFGPSIIRATSFHFYHSNRCLHYKIAKDTKVYYYLITSNNESYHSFKQIGLRRLNETHVDNPSPSFRLLARAANILVKPDICLECTFHSDNLADKTMRVIRNNSDMLREVYEHVNTCRF